MNGWDNYTSRLCVSAGRRIFPTCGRIQPGDAVKFSLKPGPWSVLWVDSMRQVSLRIFKRADLLAWGCARPCLQVIDVITCQCRCRCGCKMSMSRMYKVWSDMFFYMCQRQVLKYRSRSAEAAGLELACRFNKNASQCCQKKSSCMQNEKHILSGLPGGSVDGNSLTKISSVCILATKVW